MENDCYLIRCLFVKYMCNFLFLVCASPVFDVTKASDMCNIAKCKNFCLSNDNVIRGLDPCISSVRYTNGQHRSAPLQITIEGDVYNIICYHACSKNIDHGVRANELKEDKVTHFSKQRTISQSDFKINDGLEFSSEELNKQISKTVSETVIADINKHQEPKTKISNDEYINLMKSTICSNCIPHKTYNKHIPATTEMAEIVSGIFTKAFGSFMPK